MNAKYVGMPHILRMLMASISAYTASSVLRANWNPTCHLCECNEGAVKFEASADKRGDAVRDHAFKHLTYSG
jgi:hypothetical protein